MKTSMWDRIRDEGGIKGLCKYKGIGLLGHGVRVRVKTRSEKVYDALTSGVCVDCGTPVVDVREDEEDYIGKNHVRCPKCGWQAQSQASWEE